MSTLVDRIKADLKQSPGRAGMLAVGLLVAVFVWGPHIRGMIQGDPRKKSAASGSSQTVDPATQRSSVGSGRDAATIRDEFIAISREAHALGRLANSAPAPTVHRDPFDGDLMHGPIIPADDQLPVVDAVMLRAEAEREKVEAMILKGVMISGDRGTAMFEDRVVPVGGRYRGFRVAELRIDSVVLAGEAGVHEVKTWRDGGSMLNKELPVDGEEDQR